MAKHQYEVGCFLTINIQKKIEMNISFKYIVLILLFIVAVGSLSAQQDPNYTFYRFNMNIINPAYAAGVPAVLAANRMAGSYLRSGAVANRLIESGLNPGMVRPPSSVVPGVAAGYNALFPP